MAVWVSCRRATIFCLCIYPCNASVIKSRGQCVCLTTVIRLVGFSCMLAMCLSSLRDLLSWWSLPSCSCRVSACSLTLSIPGQSISSGHDHPQHVLYLWTFLLIGIVFRYYAGGHLSWFCLFEYRGLSGRERVIFCAAVLLSVGLLSIQILCCFVFEHLHCCILVSMREYETMQFRYKAFQQASPIADPWHVGVFFLMCSTSIELLFARALPDQLFKLWARPVCALPFNAVSACSSSE